jgi:hypothetical protein
MTIKLIETKTIVGATAALSFTNIPETFTDLVLKVSARADETGVWSAALMGFNGDLGNNYNSRDLFGNGSTVSSSSDSSRASFVIGPAIVGLNATANTFANSEVYIPNYTSSSAKSFLMDSVTENNATEIRHYIQAGLWNNTAAINRIDIYRATIAGSTYSLYGITKGSDGIVTVS